MNWFQPGQTSSNWLRPIISSCNLLVFLILGNLPLLCDFEEDLCGLAQTSSGQLDWIRYSGRTQSQNTGPELAQSGDYYIYVEMSSQSGERRKKPGDKAR